jgi:hypothetical protein
MVAAFGYWVQQLVVTLRGGVPSFSALPPRRLAVIGVVLLIFTAWRNVPSLPLADFLAP